MNEQQKEGTTSIVSDFTVISSTYDVDESEELLLTQEAPSAILKESQVHLSEPNVVHPTEVFSEIDEFTIYFEVYYVRVAIEEYEIFEYIQIEDIIPPPMSMSEAISEPPENREMFERIRSILHPTVDLYEDEDNDIEAIQSLPTTKTIRGAIDGVFNITPCHGFLPPFECQLVCLAFHPRPYTFSSAQAACHVYGGASEKLSLRGMAADVNYMFDTEFVEFGRQVRLCRL